MRNISYTHRERGGIITYALAASAFIGLLALTGFEMLPEAFETDAQIRIEPKSYAAIVGDTFTLDIIVDARIPVNVFAGELSFNENVVNITSIDYNTSIADIWAEKPWYENGAGTLNFIGGTAKRGGFTGTGSLIKVHMTAKGVGDGTVVMHDAHILQHDGLGTDVPLHGPIDTILTVTTHKTSARSRAHVDILQELPSADLNNDGKVSVVDVSIFMIHLLSEDPRYDFNLDGTVDTDDLSILLRTK